MFIQDAVFPSLAATPHLTPSGPAAAGQGSDSCVVAEIAVAEYPAWHALLERSPDASIYSQPEYLAALCRAAGGRFRILTVSHGGELAGGVALYERRFEPGLVRCTATAPLSQRPGAASLRHEVSVAADVPRRGAMTALAGRLETMRYASVNLRSAGTVTDVRPFLLCGWQAVPSYSYVVPLDDLAGQWDRVEHNLRRLIKRCETRDKLQFTDDTDFDAFYRLHVSTLGRRGVGAYLPEPAFRQYFAELHAAGLARLFHARLPDGRSIATQLVLLGPNATSQTVSRGRRPAVPANGRARVPALACLRDPGGTRLSQQRPHGRRAQSRHAFQVAAGRPAHAVAGPEVAAKAACTRIGSSVTRSVGRVRRGLARVARRARGGAHA